MRPSLLEKVLILFFYTWMALFALLNLVAIVGAFTTRPFWEAVGMIQRWYGPSNFLNVFLEILLVSPAIVAYSLKEKIKNKRITIRYTTKAMIMNQPNSNHKVSLLRLCCSIFVAVVCYFLTFAILKFAIINFVFNQTLAKYTIIVVSLLELLIEYTSCFVSILIVYVIVKNMNAVILVSSFFSFILLLLSIYSAFHGVPLAIVAATISGVLIGTWATVKGCWEIEKESA